MWSRLIRKYIENHIDKGIIICWKSIGFKSHPLGRSWDPDLSAPSLPEESRPPGRALTPGLILYPRSLRDQTAQESVWVAEARWLLGQGPFRPSSSARKQSWAPDLCAPSLPEESLPAESALTTGTKERVGLPGVLTKANRITGETSSSQRQLEHQTPEITRWLKANVRILLTETKTIHHHQNPVLPPQQVLDNPTCPKSKIKI